MVISKNKLKFLYPCSNQFPFDSVATRIVRELEKRSWSVPGTMIEFYNSGSKYERYQMVSSIVGLDYKLEFGRIQGLVNGERNNIAALYRVCIPQQIIEVYSDESGPVYYLYVGENWGYDMDWFINSKKLDSEYGTGPRKYLKYKGNIRTRRYDGTKPYNGRPTELIPCDELGSMNKPIDDEPAIIDLDSTLEEFKKWLEIYVLNYILSFPEDN